MKKTALTFGLFSLVVVATSFAAPITNSAEQDTIIGNQSTGRDRKVDFHTTTNDLKNNQSEGFRQDRQSLGNTIKLD
ncbi:hypothetical protein EYY60_07010 [Flavobacterium zhairuonense]|uniref:hypothetical protein n=1 Tax=Flavobacterium zhairuonense TaxID=2493631 RepID=UPI0010499E44|nr:hypothetical protein [Flavobacterium zhairuonense]KAF2511989.1 hypothetical protein EYY60_07010 [Flavobacterium zhairuonense]